MLINPEIVWASEETQINEEGCLSVPGIYDGSSATAPSPCGRWTKTVSAATLPPQNCWPFAFEHEMDHLMGKVFVEYLSPAQAQPHQNQADQATKRSGQSMRVGLPVRRNLPAPRSSALWAAGFTVPLVLTQPDRPAGRGLQLQASAVKQTAIAHAIPVAQPRSLRLDGNYPDEAQAGRAACRPPSSMCWWWPPMACCCRNGCSDLPRLGCLNIHASLLPRWRGAAPIHRAIEAGDAHTGVTIMQMDAGLDTGAMCLVERLPIAPDDTTASLHDKLAALGAEMIVQALTQAQTAPLPQTPQPLDGITYAHKIAKDEAWLDWSHSAPGAGAQNRAPSPRFRVARRSTAARP